MADIASSESKMNDLEISVDAPVSEAVMTKVGANINALIDAAGASGALDGRLDYLETGNYRNTETFNSNGTWTCPSNVNRVLVVGCGGGAGGGATFGGCGAPLVVQPVDVAGNVTVTVGAGGAAGADGANSAFGSLTMRGGVYPGAAADLAEAHALYRREGGTGPGQGNGVYQPGDVDARAGGAGPFGNGGGSGGDPSANTGAGGSTFGAGTGPGGSGKVIVFW